MNQNEIVEALLAAARGVVAARYPEQVGPLWAGLEPSLRGAAARLVHQAVESQRRFAVERSTGEAREQIRLAKEKQRAFATEKKKEAEEDLAQARKVLEARRAATIEAARALNDVGDLAEADVRQALALQAERLAEDAASEAEERLGLEESLERARNDDPATIPVVPSIEDVLSAIVESRESLRIVRLSRSTSTAWTSKKQVFLPEIWAAPARDGELPTRDAYFSLFGEPENTAFAVPVHPTLTGVRVALWPLRNDGLGLASTGYPGGRLAPDETRDGAFAVAVLVGGEVRHSYPLRDPYPFDDAEIQSIASGIQNAIEVRALRDAGQMSLSIVPDVPHPIWGAAQLADVYGSLNMLPRHRKAWKELQEFEAKNAPQPQAQPQPQPQPQPQARDQQAADKREKEERRARAIASATKESMKNPEYLRAFQEAIPSTGPFAQDSLLARELYQAASYAKVAQSTATEAIRHAANVDYHVRLPIPGAAIRSESTTVDIVRAAKWFSDKALKGAEKRREDEATRKRAEEKYGAFYTDALGNLATAKKALADRRKLGKPDWGWTVKEESDVKYYEGKLGLMESGKYVVPEDALAEARQRLAKERAPAKKA